MGLVGVNGRSLYASLNMDHGRFILGLAPYNPWSCSTLSIPSWPPPQPPDPTIREFVVDTILELACQCYSYQTSFLLIILSSSHHHPIHHLPPSPSPPSPLLLPPLSLILLPWFAERQRASFDVHLVCIFFLFPKPQKLINCISGAFFPLFILDFPSLSNTDP